MHLAQSSSATIPSSISIIKGTHVQQDRGTILLVEDESFLLEVTSEILESAGYRVLKTRSALEAAEVFRQFHSIVQLLVTDVVLPGQNGRDLANELRSISPELRIVFVSGYPENAVTRNGIHEVGMSYLPKPFSSQSLTRKVKQALEKQEEQKTSL